MPTVVLQRAMPKNPGWPVPGVLSVPAGPQADARSFVTLEDAYILDADGHSLADKLRRPQWPYTPYKIPGITAITAGHYRLCLVRSTRFRRYLPAVCDVPGFTGILIHPGNWQEDTQGCILVGLDVAEAGRMVTSSAAAVDQIVAWLDAQTEATWIEIWNPS